MAERRMFAKTIIDSDAFLEMPATSQLLYFHLGLRADDEGFVNKPKSIMRDVGCKDDDMRVLITKNFVIPFESGVVVIKHWRIHNWIRKERIQETKYTDERALLAVKENGAYTLNVRQLSDTCQTSGCQLSAEIRLDKDRLGKISNTRFAPPSIDDVQAYCRERNNKVDAQTFVDFYTAKGWKVGSQSMKDWKACVRTWEKRDERKPRGGRANHPMRTYTDCNVGSRDLLEDV